MAADVIVGTKNIIHNGGGLVLLAFLFAPLDPSQLLQIKMQKPTFLWSDLAKLYNVSEVGNRILPCSLHYTFDWYTMMKPPTHIHPNAGLTRDTMKIGVPYWMHHQGD